MSISEKKILITGGAGFIGSHLCEELTVTNEVVVLDNYSTGSVANHIDNVEYISGDTIDISKHIKFKPDLVFHLGEYSRVENSFVDFKKVLDFNICGTQSVVNFCLKNNCKLIYAGSSTKYADDGLGSDQSPYAWSKSTNTQFIKNCGDWFNLNYVITYFYNAYGNREIKTGNYATLIALFAEKMRNSKSLTIVSPGTQARNFTHVKDIVTGILLAAESGSGDGYGIGNPKSYTIIDVADLFGGAKEMIPERPGNRMNGPVVNEKLISMGWRPQTELVDYINHLKNNNWEQ